jgi:(p)ppGpp synthase/HD superfamily hydrolase
MNGHALRDLAQAWATVAHDGQSRKGAGEPYINHPARVADLVQGWRRKTLAWLHDTIEDAENPRQMEFALRVVFPPEIVDDLMMLSRLEDEDGNKQTYQGWIEDIAASGNEDVIAVKLADLQDNMGSLDDLPNGESMKPRYLKAEATLMEAQG